MNAQAENYFLFSLGRQKYLVPLLAVREVASVGDVTPVPFMPKYFLGVVNLRGRVISVIDLRLRLGMSVPRDPETESLMLVFQNESQLLGAVVSSVEKVVAIGREEIQPLKDRAPWVTGAVTYGDQVALVFDETRVTSIEDESQEEAA